MRHFSFIHSDILCHCTCSLAVNCDFPAYPHSPFPVLPHPFLRVKGPCELVKWSKFLRNSDKLHIFKMKNKTDIFFKIYCDLWEVLIFLIALENWLETVSWKFFMYDGEYITFCHWEWGQFLAPYLRGSRITLPPPPPLQNWPVRILSGPQDGIFPNAST